jgi:hypothetical protein
LGFQGPRPGRRRLWPIRTSPRRSPSRGRTRRRRRNPPRGRGRRRRPPNLNEGAVKDEGAVKEIDDAKREAEPELATANHEPNAEIAKANERAAKRTAKAQQQPELEEAKARRERDEKIADAEAKRVKPHQERRRPHRPVDKNFEVEDGRVHRRCSEICALVGESEQFSVGGARLAQVWTGGGPGTCIGLPAGAPVAPRPL